MIQQAIMKESVISKLTYLSQHSTYSRIMNEIGIICRANFIDDSHGLSHAIKIAELS